MRYKHNKKDKAKKEVEVEKKEDATEDKEESND